MPAPKIDAIRCIKRDTYDKFDFLKGVPDDEICVPPKDDRRCAFLAVRDKHADGVLFLTCGGPRRPPFTVLTENGNMYEKLTKAELKDFYEKYNDPSRKGPVKMKGMFPWMKAKGPVEVDKKQTRSFFVKMFGGAEFTEEVRKEFCVTEKNDCTPPPSELE